MKLLITSVFRATEEEKAELERLGYEIYFQPDEREKIGDDIPCDEIEGIICNGLFLYTPPERFPQLRFVQLTSAGLDRVPMDYMAEHGITVFNARGVYSAPMAEYAVCGILQLYKQSAFFEKNKASHIWEKHRGLEELGGKTVCTVGCGSVGAACAERLRAFGCKIIGVSKSGRASGFDEMYTVENLAAAAEKSDIIILSLPLSEETRHIVNGEILGKMKDGAILVNIARGEIIDTAALEKELCTGRLRAVLDVFEDEPLDESSVLWELPNVIVTPHNSFVGEHNRRRLFEVIKSNLTV